MERIEELERLIEGMDDTVQTVVRPMLEDIAFLEADLRRLRALPQIEVNAARPVLQRATPAAKLYKEKLQQYNNCLRTLLGVMGKHETEEESPLRAYLNSLREQAE